MVTGFLALFIGFLVYFLLRPPDIYFMFFIKAADSPSLLNWPSLKLIGGVIPSFLQFAFSLILGGLLGSSNKDYVIICSAWLLINALFELGQRHALAASALFPVGSTKFRFWKTGKLFYAIS
jgi:hypothetical protein